MSVRDYGGPAFPAAHFDLGDEEHGMTLRDYFAAKAMQGFAAAPDIYDAEADEVARLAYVWADAMLKARTE